MEDGFKTGAFDAELFFVSFGYAFDHVGAEGAAKAVEALMLAAVACAGINDKAILDFSRDSCGNDAAEFAEVALDGYLIGCDGYCHTGGDRHGLFSYFGHDWFLELPNFADDFAAYADFACLASAHYAFGGGEDAVAETAEDDGDFGDGAVATETGTAPTAESADYGVAVFGVTETEGEGPGLGVVDDFTDIAVLFEDAGNLFFLDGGGDCHLGEAGFLCVADAGEHIRDGI